MIVYTNNYKGKVITTTMTNTTRLGKVYETTCPDIKESFLCKTKEKGIMLMKAKIDGQYM